MHTKGRLLSKLQSESFLLGILCLISLISWCNDCTNRRGRPYVYPTTVILRCYLVRIWMRIPSNNALHYYLSIDDIYHRKICRACGLHILPDRRTFDRRFKILPIRDMISSLGQRFIAEQLVDGTTVSVDSTLVRARGHVWHRTDIVSNTIPRSGIDTDARWGFATTKGWIFGYKMHLTCPTGKLVVPLC